MSVESNMVLPASVIVPTRGRPELLSECVESILAGSARPAELILIDQSDTSHPELGGYGEVGGCRVIYSHSRSRGSSAARNEGCRLATQEILIFTDDDMLVAPDWVETMTRAVQREAATTLMSGRVRFLAKGDLEGFAPSLIDDDEPRLFEGRLWYEVLLSGNMACHRRILEDLGPFDERLGAGSRYLSAEDNDYCFRALDAGYRIRYLPEAVVHHQAWRPKGQHWRLQWTYGVGQGAYFAKHIHLRDRYALHRLRDEVQRSARRSREKRRTDPVGAKDDAAYTVGLLYGSARFTLRERLAGRSA